MSMNYIESFDDGPGGWVADLRSPLPVWGGVAHCYSPWSVDANHAPPGAGYLHLLMYLATHANSQSSLDSEQCRSNRFVENGYSRDLTNAKLTVRLARGHGPCRPSLQRSYAVIASRPWWCSTSASRSVERR